MPAAKTERKGYSRWNSARGATCNPDRSTPTTDGLNGNGKSAKERKESPFACPCRSRKPTQTDGVQSSKTRQPNRKPVRLPVSGVLVCARADRGPSLRLQRGAAFQQTQFPIGDESVESVRLPLTIETNSSLKIPGLIHQESTLEELRVTTIRLKK